jgi:hypothetical protein
MAHTYSFKLAVGGLLCGTALLNAGCVGKVDARLRAAISGAESSWVAYDEVSAPKADLDDEDKAEREKLREELNKFFSKAGEVK